MMHLSVLGLRQSARAALLIGIATILFDPTSAHAIVYPSSGTVTVAPSPPVSTADPSVFSVTIGGATITAGTNSPPTGEPTVNVTITTAGTIRVCHSLSGATDMRPFDSFSFVVGTSATRVGDFVYLVDATGRRRWFSLPLRSTRSWQRPLYFINSYTGQDPGFDPTRVVAVWFQQSAMQVGDVISIGAVKFEHGVVNHADVPGPWIIDIGTGSITTSTDSARDGYSIRADLTANGQGQADIAIDARGDRIHWDWSNKSYVSFSYKDSNTNESHYFLVYDVNGYYRQWIFQNTSPGQWIRVTADLNDTSYYQSGPVDLSNIVYFEVGVWAGTPGGSYSFLVDDVQVH